MGDGGEGEAVCAITREVNEQTAAVLKDLEEEP